MKRLVLSAAALLLAAVPAYAQNVLKFNVQGTNLDGSPYTGTAVITLTSDTTCEIDWTTGPTTSHGICMKNQNAFAAGYVLGDGVGLVIYEIKKDGSLEGLWTVAGTNGTGTEVLTPIK
jgi:hypothetical protein